MAGLSPGPGLVTTALETSVKFLFPRSWDVSLSTFSIVKCMVSSVLPCFHFIKKHDAAFIAGCTVIVVKCLSLRSDLFQQSNRDRLKLKVVVYSCLCIFLLKMVVCDTNTIKINEILAL